MGKMAVSRLSDGVVINVIIAEENDMPPDGTRLIPVLDWQQCNIGWFFDGNSFINPEADGLTEPNVSSDGN